ncbi:ABC transporter, membrane protein [Syntrophotalea carbinolica DSM 2380]|uniref:ABC transporter, membrane protein n=1 Tax=Syntrophotalea carbinolica (strain DSM 2380 / NBRC 103641 / GraBd1) TaxID=338963 RepID=Q3A1X3_SYNC1|nr:energy-coupling factor transporter transmembrane component T [Syntrophotalea carbinolica]ABA89634.3 ABC transporter, membrane protein [Syntrophotalea carbinolica DSM 2380]
MAGDSFSRLHAALARGHRRDDGPVKPDRGLALPVGVKMLLALTLSCLAFLARSWPFLGAITAVNALVFLLLRPQGVSWWRQGRYFVFQSSTIVVLYIIRFGSLDGVTDGLLISWQLFLAFWPTMVFAKTTSQTKMVRAMNRIMPGHVSFVLATCLKFAPHLLEEVRDIYEGQVLRGARILPKDLVKPWNWPDLVHCVVVPAVVQGMALAGNIALAARARDFGLYARRTCWPGE